VGGITRGSTGKDVLSSLDGTDLSPLVDSVGRCISLSIDSGFRIDLQFEDEACRDLELLVAERTLIQFVQQILTRPVMAKISGRDVGLTERVR